jgi:uncharacterized protein
VLIDFHTHVFAPHIIERRTELVHSDACFASLYNSPGARMVSAEALLDSMDASQVDISVICNIGWQSHDLCVENNEYLLDATRRYPGRLAALVTVAPQAGDLAAQELGRCIQAGCHGLGEMRPDPPGLDMSYDSLWTPLVSLLVEHNLLWLGHASEPLGHIYAGKGNLPPEVYYPFICRYPQLRFVMAHWGGGLPFYNLMPEVAQSLANVYYDSAASDYLYSPDIYERVISLAGATRIVLGSDYPLLSQSRLLKTLNSLPLSPAEIDSLGWRNALGLLNMDRE